MGYSSSLRAPRNVNSSLLTVLVNTVRAETSDTKFRISLLSTKECLKRVGRTDTASPRHAAGVLRTKMVGPKTDIHESIIASSDPTLHRRAEMEQVGQPLSASMAVETYAGSDGRMSE